MNSGIGELRVLAGSRAGRALLGVVGGIFLLTLIGLAVLWPRGDAGVAAGAQPPKSSVQLISVADEPCVVTEPGGQQCRAISFEAGGERQDVVLGPTDGAPSLSAGQEVVVQPVPGTGTYSYVGIDRSRGLMLAAALLGVLAIVALRIRGLLAIAGVGLSLLLLVEFLVPAILAGDPPLLVALVAASAVTFVTLTLTNGLGVQTIASALGITITLLLTVGLGLLAVRGLRLDGTDGELSTLIAVSSPGVSLEGVVLCGMVISALGVLADTAVTQASAVMALRHTDPQLDARALYRRAVKIGQDHLSATIHTLVLAYAGTVLALMLVLTSANSSYFDVVNQTDIVEPIIGAIVGCAALIAAVPLTTGLAALFIARIPSEQLPEAHAHAH